MNDIENEGDWVWANGVPADYTNWNNNEPNNWTEWNEDGEDCGALGWRAGWNDADCSREFFAICEYDSDYCEECEENDDEMTTYSIYTEYFWSDPTFN